MTVSPTARLAGLAFDNVARRALRLDPITHRRARQVMNATISRVVPTPFKSPRLRLVGADPKVAAVLGLSAAGLAAPEFPEYFSGLTVHAANMDNMECRHVRWP